MTSKTSKHLKAIEAIDLAAWAVSFWLVKRKVRERDAHYSVLRVDTDAKLQKRLKGYLKQQLQSEKFHLAPYDFNNADGEGTLFTIAADATDFTKVADAIAAGFDNAHVKNYEDLLNSWAYVVLFECGEKQLFAWRKINASTQPKTAKSRSVIFFQNHKLVDVEDKEVFLIDPRFDFFAYQDTIFIANKREFESSMNFREGLKVSAATVLTELAELKFADNVELIASFVGDNMHHLRKVASIGKSQYYKQADYMERLMKVCLDEAWGLKIENGKIVVEQATVELLLKLLNNDRLRSPINLELFDSAAKSPVARSSLGG